MGYAKGRKLKKNKNDSCYCLFANKWFQWLMVGFPAAVESTDIEGLFQITPRLPRNITSAGWRFGYCKEIRSNMYYCKLNEL